MINGIVRFTGQTYSAPLLFYFKNLSSLGAAYNVLT